jgi:hypothetical protein
MFPRALLVLVVLTVTLCAAVVVGVLLTRTDSSEPLPAPPIPTTAAGSEREPEAEPTEPTFQPVKKIVVALKPVTSLPSVRGDDPAAGMSDGETVIGIEVAGAARAYPLATMVTPQTEVFNDTVGDHPVVITWCEQCRDVAVYGRKVDGHTLTFFLPGMLWESNMVLQDVETQTLWSQVHGRGERGALEGRTLEPIAAVVTDWKSWFAAHPETSVAIPRRLTTVDVTDQRTNYTGDNGDRFVVALVRDGEAVSWPFAELRRQPVVNDRCGGRPVVVVFEPATGTARLYDPVVDGKPQPLTFRAGAGPAGRLRDEPTGSEWDAATGRATAGPLQGTRLKPVAALVVLCDTWRTFHPKSREWSPAIPARSP